MEAYQKRLVDEKAELDDKIKKLQRFVESSGAFESLNTYERSDLRRQLVHMTGYSEVLKRRINRFE